MLSSNKPEFRDLLPQWLKRVQAQGLGEDREDREEFDDHIRCQGEVVATKG